MLVSAAAKDVSHFCSQINNRRFDDESFRTLELVLVTKEVKSLIEVRSSLREFLRSEFVSVISEIAGKSVEQKIYILEFFVRVFALIGDVESCLAVRYEALVLRELKSPSEKWLQVSHTEWLIFAQQSIETRFYPIARKACENALLCLQRDHTADPSSNALHENLQVTEEIKRLKDCIATSATSRSGRTTLF